MRSWRRLTGSRAYTEPDSDDPRLRGRAYPVPFRIVWSAAVEAVRALPRWRLVSADPREGEVTAEAESRIRRRLHDVWIRIWLDEMGQTRVDVTSQSRVRRADLGGNARRIARFLHALDGRVDAGRPGTS